MKSSLVTRNVRIRNRRTSVRLEPELWRALEAIAEHEQTDLNAICSRVQEGRGPVGGFTSALRVFIVEYLVSRKADAARRGWREEPIARERAMAV